MAGRHLDDHCKVRIHAAQIFSCSATLEAVKLQASLHVQTNAPVP